jgi:hypothetical protein
MTEKGWEQFEISIGPALDNFRLVFFCARRPTFFQSKSEENEENHKWEETKKKRRRIEIPPKSPNTRKWPSQTCCSSAFIL